MRFNLITTILASFLTATIASCCSTPIEGASVPIPPITENPTINAEVEITRVDDSDFYLLHKDTLRKISTIIINTESDRDTYRRMLEAQQ